MKQAVESNNNKKSLENEIENNDAVAQLIKIAGPEEAVDPIIQQRVYKQLHKDWLRAHGSKRPKKIHNHSWFWLSVPITAAAAIFLSVSIFVNQNWLNSIDSDPNQIIAKVSVLQGEALSEEIGDKGQSRKSIAAGDLIFAGQRIITGSKSGMGLQLNQVTSLRVDENTQLNILNANHVYLVQGAIYFDSGTNRSAKQITVSTAYGEFRDIGTQFELRINGNDAIVRVREGEVEAKESGLFGQKFQIRELKQATLKPSQAPQLTSLKADDESWRWIHKLANEYNLQGSSLDGFLQWLSRENGWQLKYQTDQLAFKATTIQLSGSIQGIYGEQALNTVCSTTLVTCHLVDATLVVKEK